ncbi:MAG: hypothetical protein GY787_30570 [Alteromonadales bacterium]|nr:hypothetical protein [Alteromonadales bacterium]MCP4990102.1 hypothetical protein [Colwellia sp.]
MIDQFSETMSIMETRYRNILSKYYPAHGSTGFTERNLTNNLVASLEFVLGKDCISWFEAPICKDTNKHMDAVVFFEDVTILIEAKRFTSVGAQLNSINEDVDRMFSSKTIDMVERGLPLSKSTRKRYSIVLADVWTETNEKINVYETWPNILPTCFKELMVFSKRLPFDDLPVDGEWKDNYKILIAIAEIKI